MIKFKRLTIALAALFIASATAWADEAKVYTEAVALNSLKAGDVLTDGFSITKNIGDYIKVKGYKKDSGTAETEEYSGLLNACTYPGGVVITVSDYSISGNFTPYADGKDANAWIVSKKEVNGSLTMLYLDGYNYLPTIALTEVTKGKQWKIESMPASNIELQVEYYAESNLFLSKDALADKGSIAVTAGDLGVEFGNDGKSANTVTEGTAMTVKYTGTKKVIGVKVEKKASVTYPLLSAATTSDYGKVVCAAGHLHEAKTAVPDGCTAVGILGKVTETGHGLILALQDATSQNWNTINGWTSVTTYAGTTLKLLPDDAARGTNLTSYTTLGETAVSNWAVAQKDDYETIFINLGSRTGDNDGTTYDAKVNAYITTGVGGDAIDGSYWSATEYNGSLARYFGGGSWDGNSKSGSNSVRPVLGF